MPILPYPEPRWTPDEDFPYEDVRWRYVSENRSPITVEVDSAASNTYGGPIFLSLEQGGQTIGVWLDEEIWEALYAAGVRAGKKGREMTEDGWT